MTASAGSGPSSSLFSIERVVVLLSPFFLAAGTWLAGVIAANVPFAPYITAQDIMGVEIAAFLGLAGIVIKWLHGRQIPEIAQLPKPLPPTAVSATDPLTALGTEEGQVAIEAAVRQALSGLASSPQPVV